MSRQLGSGTSLESALKDYLWNADLSYLARHFGGVEFVAEYQKLVKKVNHTPHRVNVELFDAVCKILVARDPEKFEGRGREYVNMVLEGLIYNISPKVVMTKVVRTRICRRCSAIERAERNWVHLDSATVGHLYGSCCCKWKYEKKLVSEFASFRSPHKFERGGW